MAYQELSPLQGEYLRSVKHSVGLKGAIPITGGILFQVGRQWHGKLEELSPLQGEYLTSSKLELFEAGAIPITGGIY